MKRELLLLALAALLPFQQGCVYAGRNGYCDEKPLVRKSIPLSMKIPVTYSVEIFRADGIVKNVDGIEGVHGGSYFVGEIGRALQKTGLFSEVSYTGKDVGSDYHISFRFWRSGTTQEDWVTYMTPWCFTFFLVPGGCEYTLDASANIFVGGKSGRGFGEAETSRVVMWLPFVFTFFTGFWHIGRMDDSVINAIVNDVAEYHYKNFILQKNVPVTSSNLQT